MPRKRHTHADLAARHADVGARHADVGPRRARVLAEAVVSAYVRELAAQ